MKMIKKLVLILVLLFCFTNQWFAWEVLITPAWWTCITVYWDNTNWAQNTNASYICAYVWNTNNNYLYINSYSYNGSFIANTTKIFPANYCSINNMSVWEIQNWNAILYIKSSCSWYPNIWMHFLYNNKQFTNYIYNYPAKSNYSFDWSRFYINPMDSTYYAYNTDFLSLESFVRSENTNWITNQYTIPDIIWAYYIRGYSPWLFYMLWGTSWSSAYNLYYRVWSIIVAEWVDCIANWRCVGWYNYLKFKNLNNINYYSTFWPSRNFFTTSTWDTLISSQTWTLEYLSGSTMYYSSMSINASIWASSHINKIMFYENWSFKSTYYRAWNIYWNFTNSEVYWWNITNEWETQTWWSGWGWGWGWGASWSSWATYSWAININFTFWQWKIENNESNCSPFGSWYIFNYINSTWDFSILINNEWDLLPPYSYLIFWYDVGNFLIDFVNNILIYPAILIFSFINFASDIIIDPILSWFIHFNRTASYCFFNQTVIVPSKVQSTYITNTSTAWLTNLDYIYLLVICIATLVYISKRK